jgi:tubulin--tyrosine ligase
MDESQCCECDCALSMSATVNAVVSWPSAPLTASLVHKSLESLGLPLSFTSEIPEPYQLLLQWSTYDALDHELAASNPTNVLVSSYTIRKALIRKHFLSQCLLAYTTKHPDSVLTKAVPRTWYIDISFADELDEMWTDELWDLGQELGSPAKWWILKPGMADRGNDIHIFNSKAALRGIFDKFEGDLDSDEDSEDAPATITSHLRHFVIQVSSNSNVVYLHDYQLLQEYISSPLLLDPLQVTGHTVHSPASLRGHKVRCPFVYALPWKPTSFDVVPPACVLCLVWRIDSLSLPPYSGPIRRDSIFSTK